MARADPLLLLHWSAIVASGEERLGSQKKPASHLEELCQTYWTPLYTFVRSRGHSVDDAQDLTQSFFAHLIEREIYARADREKGGSAPSCSLRSRTFWPTPTRASTLSSAVAVRNSCHWTKSRAEAAESLFQTHFAS